MKLDWIPFAFLPVNKPAGPTSHDVVARVRRLLPRKTKVGHTGTLDPFASGVMIIAIGKATRFADDVHLLSKSYRARLELGRRTDTLDNTGQFDLEMPVPPIEASQLAELESRFLGTQMQMPPIYSAKKIGGRKSYELARLNKPVELEAREITIEALKLKALDTNSLDCEVTCSTGTYIRSLGRDIAETLGTCGHLSVLVRTSVGPIKLEDCVSLDALSEQSIVEHLYPVSRLLPQYPEVPLETNAFGELLQGRPFKTEAAFPQRFIGVYQEAGVTRAIFRCNSNGETIQSKQLCYLSE